MKSKTLASALALALPLTAFSAVSASAQTAAPAPIEQGHTLLAVNAQGTSTREPDMATFSAGVTTRGDTASAALKENARLMNQVIAALRRAGIASKDIQTRDLSINPVYSQPARKPDGSYDPNERRIVAYESSNRVNVRQRKLEDYGKVIDALVSAGANEVNGPGFTLAEPEQAEDEARADAIKEARRRADLYAQAAGLHVVRILSISESGGYSPQIMVTAAKRMYAEASPAPPPVAAGELDVQVNLNVQFELAPN
ncbi:SIMPL domain-containing protein [Novosphingobium mangrovi (ex Huang et al. 2023)]|uniref:SIMPL domain-containing protein n=1 Tax=Novosphingobium mangrovi (ex Huang et al. 2023) TaxID=2976432 RepID=A0ABT2I735_9SPHN|nr:SIMPL domain-containing protein [Novosphingobium mangrovi (ex Huang et al. 2023)]MCT2400636.1 SIMPL domain-containing protein [Novosphingobium mangrovi (ex Huang et al. 2023)]